MRLTILFFLFTLTHYCNAQIQEGILIYGLKANTTNEEKLTGTANNYLKNSSKALESFEFRLIFNKDYALFEKINRLNSDTNFTNDFGLILAPYEGKTITDFSKKLQITFLDDINIASNFLKSEWTITNETKLIGKFLCSKATMLKELPKSHFLVEAWYCPEVSRPIGPNEFVNQLPGAILELRMPTATFYLKEIIINPDKKVSIEWPKNIKTITKEDHEKKLKAFFAEIRKN